MVDVIITIINDNIRKHYSVAARGLDDKTIVPST